MDGLPPDVPQDRRDTTSFLAAIEGLRDDVREDIGHLRDDVREDVKELRGDLMTFIATHGADHRAQRLESEQAHAAFEQYIQANALAEARRDGYLGAFRFVLDQLSKHGRLLLGLGASIVGSIAVLGGFVHIDVVIH